jgi:hypothetical protein
MHRSWTCDLPIASPPNPAISSCGFDREFAIRGGTPVEEGARMEERYAARPTIELELTPEFVQALRQLEPKGRSRVPRYVLALTVFVAVAWLAVVTEAGHRIASAWHRMGHNDQAATSIAPAPSVPAQPVEQPIAQPTDSDEQAPYCGVFSSSSPKPSKPPKTSQRRFPR